MARSTYMVWNGATAALTAFLAPVASGTAIKTLLQVKPTTNIEVIAWGYILDIATPTAAVKMELLTTGTVAATGLTAYNSGDVIKYGASGGVASAISLGTSASGFTATGEGTITATRLLDVGPMWASQYSTQFPLDRESNVVANDFLRVRVTTATSVGVLAWVAYAE